MLGNCATGRLSTVSAPTSTMTMEITMATIGRLMKNLDMVHPSLSSRGWLTWRCLILGHIWLGVHTHAGAHPLHSFNYDSVVRVQPVRNDPSVVNPVAHGDRANVNFVVGADDSDLVAALQLRYCSLRQQHRPRLRPDYRAHFGISAGPQNIVGIGKKSGDSNRSRGLVYLAVGKIKFSFERIA